MAASDSPRDVEPESRTLSRVRDWWIEQTIRHHKLILVLGALLTVLSVWLAAQLELALELAA